MTDKRSLPPELYTEDYFLNACEGYTEFTESQGQRLSRRLNAAFAVAEVRPGMRVLDVGAGSGWTTALLAHLVGPSGAVHGVELEPELVRFGSANLAATDQPWASIVAAEPGVLGLPQLAPFDRILVSAEPEVLPQTLVEQLGEGGVMVIPVAGVMLRVRRRGMHIERSEHGFYAFVPLR